jgi:hypothetical protein
MAKAKTAAEQTSLLDGVAPAPGKVIEEAQAAWNEYATKYKWKQCRVLDKTRQAAMKRAVGDYGGLAGFRAALASVAKNRFVQGKIAPREGYKQFVANIDWFCRPVTVRKVLEDAYEDEGADKVTPSLSKRMEPDAEWARVMRGYERGRWWPSGVGPRPEEPGCRVTPSILISWRERHGVIVSVPKVESREDRLRSSISSYRKVGNYKRANELEQELADMEKRQAVLVPAPDVASWGMPKEEPSLVNRPRHTVTDIVAEDEPPPWTDIPEGEDCGEVERD